jgi:hypothetical protein
MSSSSWAATLPRIIPSPLSGSPRPWKTGQPFSALTLATRTSAKAHHYAPIRSGTDIAFLGGMIKYIIDNDKYFKQYVRLYKSRRIESFETPTASFNS